MVSAYFLSAAEAQQANISTTRIFIMALEIHTICTMLKKLLKSLKGLSHDMDLAFDDMFG
jgi:hypothetical protein